MSSKRYTEEFKIEAVKQITERGYSVYDVAQRLGVTTHSLYAWRKKYASGPQHDPSLDQDAEIKRLRAELKRVTEERDIFKKGHRILRQRVPVRYAFIRAHLGQFAIRNLCRMMQVHRSGYYAWIKQPKSGRQKDDERLSGLIKQLWLESGCVYGYRKAYKDLREIGETCGPNRVARLMKQAGLKAQVGYNKPRHKGGKVSVLADNHLNQDFDVQQPNQAWVTDITYIRTYEGWLFLAVVIDLFSRQVVGWSMQPKMQVDLVLNALLMAVWRRKPKNPVLVHSDQGTQYTSSDWQNFLKTQNLLCSMSRRGNCYDNAVAESFFQLLKRERIRRKTYKDREEARRDIFNYIEMFYNPVRRHGYNDNLSPMEFERRHFSKTQSV
ncbi:IS3 family transposase [Syntrophotalea acetylenivorans]|uniref:IS3 family transposase n=1 Tax=Syntrophotalea acetylenivorans TaxID=1842532 RepID=UPI0011AB74C9|nr:IS3 family transposase [Syntrophotalea acetylenivorans]